MTSTEQWRCTYCETWNLANSTACLVCERERTRDAPAGLAAPGTPTVPPTAPTGAYSMARPLPPPPSAGPGAAGPVPDAITPVLRLPSPPAPATAAPWWMIPAMIFAVGALAIAVVLVVLTLTA